MEIAFAHKASVQYVVTFGRPGRYFWQGLSLPGNLRRQLSWTTMRNSSCLSPGYVGRRLGDPGLKPTVRVGEAAMREVAAYLLDAAYGHFSRVPPTVLVKVFLLPTALPMRSPMLESHSMKPMHSVAC